MLYFFENALRIYLSHAIEQRTGESHLDGIVKVKTDGRINTRNDAIDVIICAQVLTADYKSTAHDAHARRCRVVIPLAKLVNPIHS